MHFCRYCWITFASEEYLKNAEIAVNGLTIQNEPIVIGSSSSRSRRVKILKNYPTSRINIDAEVVKKLLAKLDEQCGVSGNILMQTEFSSTKKQFDGFLL
jgi:RNA recognition motif-containing protein